MISTQVRQHRSTDYATECSHNAGQTEVRGGSAGGDSDFLARERAALGEDADLFASGNDTKQTTVEDGDDDLLGGDFSGGATHAPVDHDDMDTFESSFPAVDTTNDVSSTNSANIQYPY